MRTFGPLGQGETRRFAGEILGGTAPGGWCSTLARHRVPHGVLQGSRSKDPERSKLLLGAFGELGASLLAVGTPPWTVTNRTTRTSAVPEIARPDQISMSRRSLGSLAQAR